MTNRDYKKLLKDKGINIHQMDDTLSKELNEMETYFSISFKDSIDYFKKARKFKKTLKEKSAEVDSALADLDNFIKSIDKIIKQPDVPLDEKEMDRVNNRLKDAVEGTWTENDKLELETIAKSYITLNLKNDLGINISNKLLKNELFKMGIQTLIFFLTFFGSYFINLKLEKYFLMFGQLCSQFLIALIIFLTLEALLNLLEEKLLYWRIKKLHYSFAAIRPLMIKSKKLLAKNNC